MSPEQSIVKVYVHTAYQLQKLRIASGNRLAMNFRAKLGQAPGKTEEDLEEEEQKMLATIKAEYAKMMDGMKKLIPQKDFKGTALLSNYGEFCLVHLYMDMEKHEKNHFAKIEDILKDFRIYTEFLDKVQGIGPAMAGVLVSEIDIHKAKYASSLEKYAGIDVVTRWKLDRIEIPHDEGIFTLKLEDKQLKEDFSHVPLIDPLHTRAMDYSEQKGNVQFDQKNNELRVKVEPKQGHGGWAVYNRESLGGRSKKAEHLVDVEYTNKEGELATKKSITFSPFLKTKLMGVLASSFLRCGKDNKYAQVYYTWKERYTAAHPDYTKGHLHMMANRKMIKRFLGDLYVAWRTIEGLPVHPAYSEAKLGISAR